MVKVCHHWYRTFPAWSPLRCLARLWRINCLPASTSATSLSRARSLCTRGNCTITAWETTHWGTSTRLSSSPSCYMLHRHDGVLRKQRGWQATSRSICPTCYPARLVPSRRPPHCLNWLLLIWITILTTFSRTYSTLLTMFCTNFSRRKLITPTISDRVVTRSVTIYLLRLTAIIS